jgi:predicted acylesterase/phospholipase RssA
MQTELGNLARVLLTAASEAKRCVFNQQKAEKWTEIQVKFNEEARLAVRRALFFLRQLEQGHDKNTLTFVCRSVDRQLRGVSVSKDRDCCDRHVATDGALKCGSTGAQVPFAQIVKRWEELRADVELKCGADLIEDCETFLRVSRPSQCHIRLIYVMVPAFLHFLRQRAAVILAIVATVLICSGITAVRSLILNNIYFSTLVFLTAASPIIGLRFAARLLRRNGKTPWWDLGGPAKRTWRPMAMEPEPWAPRHPSEGRMTEARIQFSRVMRFGLNVVGWAVIVGIYLAFAGGADAGSVWRTVYAIGVLLAFILVSASTFDFLDFHSQAPLRRWALEGVVIYFAILLTLDSPVWAGVWVLYWAATRTWLLWAIRASQSIPLVAVLTVLLLAPVGITHWRKQAEVWEDPSRYIGEPDRPREIENWPFRAGDTVPVVAMALSGGGSRAAVYSALALRELRSDPTLSEIGDQIQAISSVSGGSLANAAFVAEYIRSEFPGADPTVFGRPCSNPENTIVIRESQDFLWPVLKGVFSLGGRGPGIEDAWAGCPVGLGSATIDDLRKLWRDTVGETTRGKPPFPIPLFNSVSLDRNAVVITPLARSLFSARKTSLEARSDSNRYRKAFEDGASPTWVYYRSEIYGLDDLLSRYSPTLAKAVRASANFPFGFPTVEVRTSGPLMYSPRREDQDTVSDIVRLTDGGVLSNSGLWSLSELLLSQQDSLARPGVLLIVVDASKMPVAPIRNRVLGLLGAIRDQSPKGERLHQLMFDDLADTFGACIGIVQLSLKPEKWQNVYTTWALDRGSLNRLKGMFDRRWPGAKSLIQSEWKRLKTCDPKGESPTRVYPRVPLS